MILCLFSFFLKKKEIHYINGPEVLPPPLTRKEEEKIMLQITSGKLKNRDILITHNLRLVVFIAKKFEFSYPNIEDLISIGTIGLVKAVNTFCPEKNIKLATYASRCIENEILMHLRKASQHRSEASIDEPLNIDGNGNELLLSDILGSDTDLVDVQLERESENQVLRDVVCQLSKRERTIVKLRFGLFGSKEFTQKEVAVSLGISQSYISRLEKRIIKKLKLDLEKVS
ncbi:MAG: sigma-70 family RNA polymerase sigma factor [Oscillospiraceae bacterium]|nr:sigma-70 family RNA polymerase sigma factor [Oscillospiraceae bacterium]